MKVSAAIILLSLSLSNFAQAQTAKPTLTVRQQIAQAQTLAELDAVKENWESDVASLAAMQAALTSLEKDLQAAESQVKQEGVTTLIFSAATVALVYNFKSSLTTETWVYNPARIPLSAFLMLIGMGGTAFQLRDGLLVSQMQYDAIRAKIAAVKAKVARLSQAANSKQILPLYEAKALELRTK